MSQTLIAGFDEVGRGCLAGPILAVGALFISQERFELPTSPIPGLKDSKKFNSPASRKLVFDELVRSPYLIDFGIGCIWPDEINRHGIEEANARAFYQALELLAKEPDFLLVDGIHPVRHFQKHCQRVEPRADERYWPVSAASILAKVIRDELMSELHLDFPAYSWDQNYGYGSEEHRKAIKTYGACSMHRALFIRKVLAEAA